MLKHNSSSDTLHIGMSNEQVRLKYIAMYTEHNARSSIDMIAKRFNSCTLPNILAVNGGHVEQRSPVFAKVSQTTHTQVSTASIGTQTDASAPSCFPFRWRRRTIA